MAPAPERRPCATSSTAATTNIVQPVAMRSMPRATVVSQPVRSVGDRPQDGGVDLVGDPPGPRRHEHDDQPRRRARRSDDEPALAGAADAARQRWRGARRPAPPPVRRTDRAGPGGRRRRPGRRRRHRRRRSCPGRRRRRRSSWSCLRPPPRPTTAATVGGSASWPATARSSSRTVSVVSRADTASITSTTSAPHRSTTSVRTSGVMFSAGCSPRSSIELDEVRAPRSPDRW